ncbi:MAG: hypothetical protein ACRDJI_07185 [Actinomycetota bacterium]
MTAYRTAALAAAVLLLGSLVPSSAHEESALFALTVLDDVRPDIAGLEIRVVQLTAPALLVTNGTTRPLVVDGQAGEPFLRIGGGLVEANVHSPTAYGSFDPTGDRPIPTGLDPDAAPEWVTLREGNRWSWFDPRLRYAHSAGAAAEWSVDARLGSTSVAITGGFEPLDGHGHFITKLDGVTPEVVGLEVRLLQGSIPALYVRNDTKESLKVPGREGEPFLRIGPRGVFGNVRSPTYYLAGTQTVRRVPPRADPGADPSWKRLSEEPLWAWLEYRAQLPAASEQRAALGTVPRTILDWVTPATLGTAPLEIAGRVEWIPPRRPEPHESSGATFWPWFAGAGLALVAAGVFGLWSRRN